MTTIEVTLIYKDGSTWFAGAFVSIEDAQAWVDTEKSKPYWDTETQTQMVEK